VIVKDAMKDSRALTSDERAIIRRLLTAEFAGADKLLHQSDLATVRAADLGGVLVLSFDVPPQAPRVHLDKRIPVEAEASDSDGMPIHMLVHVIDGALKEVEIFREDSQALLQLPMANQLRVITN
jgi:hypothetical protein